MRAIVSVELPGIYIRVQTFINFKDLYYYPEDWNRWPSSERHQNVDLKIVSSNLTRFPLATVTETLGR